MQTCDNCKAEFDPAQEGLVTTAKGRPACAICEGCMTGARLIKVVLRRGDVGSFAYEQYSVIESARPFPSEHAGKGLSTPIGQPKR
jgi:hypothetical protein